MLSSGNYQEAFLPAPASLYQIPHAVTEPVSPELRRWGHRARCREPRRGRLRVPTPRSSPSTHPRGTAVPKEQDPHLLAGATGLGATLGADFCKVNYAKPEDGRAPAESFKEAVRAAGRTRVITAGGNSTDVRTFLQTLHDQITIAGASGSATGRNIHQKDLASALRMTKAISSITYGGHGVDAALSVYNGESDYTI